MNAGSTVEGGYFEDVQIHNPWWEADYDELEAVSELEPRSNTYQLLDVVDAAFTGDNDERVFPQYGQNGVGKTTMLKHLVATCVERPDLGIETRSEELNRDEYEIEDALAPEQILYVPVAESLFHLQPPTDGRTESGTDRGALEEVSRVIDRFSRYHDGSRELVLLDDLGRLDLTPADRAEVLLRHVDEGTVVVSTGTLESDVSFPADAPRTSTPVPQLPRKFIDVAKSSGDELQRLLTTHQAAEETGLIRKARREFESDDREVDVVALVETLERLYFDVFDAEQRQRLDRLVQEYFEHGGFFYDANGPRGGTRGNELVKSSFSLFLYRDVARERSISEPRNLEKLCSYAAHEHDEYEFRTLADWLGVDRRTVKSQYLDVLGDATVLNPAADYGLVRQYRTRLQLQNPRHAILLSQRRAHKGFGAGYAKRHPDPDFESLLARTTAFDHAVRLQYKIGADDTDDYHDETRVEYARTDAGIVDMVLRNRGTVYPFVLAYNRSPETAEEIVRTFDPSTGKHRSKADSGGRSIATIDVKYRSPLRFVLDDTLPHDLRQDERLVSDASSDDIVVCHLPLWLFLLLG